MTRVCRREKKTVQRFASEIVELRSLGFAEGLEAIDHARGIVVRLESGRIGLAVEFCAGEDMPRYAVRPLVRAVDNWSGMATDSWSDILRDIHQRAPPSDDE